MSAFKQEAHKGEFTTLLINSLSHELMTPITEILNLCGRKKNGSFFDFDRTKTLTRVNGTSLLKTNNIDVADVQSIPGSPKTILEKMPLTPTASTIGERNLDVISQTANRMFLLLHSLLTFSQILNSTFQTDLSDTFCVREVYKTVMGFFSTSASKRKSRLNCTVTKA